MKKLLLFTLLFCGAAIAGDPDQPQKTDIFPKPIFVGDEVEMGLAALFQFCIATGINFDGDRYYFQIDEKNHITVIIIGFVFDPCAGGGSITGFTDFYSLGQLPEGNYTAQMHLVSADNLFPPPPGMFGPPLGEVISFEVNGAPRVIPSNGMISLIVLGLMILILSFIRLKRSKSKLIFFSCLLMFSGVSLSKTFHILITSEEGAPTADEIVEQANSSPSPPKLLLSSLNENRPAGVGFLLRDRPVDGNLKDLIEAHPEWSLARLYRYVVVTYPDDADEEMILASFAADTDVISAGFADESEVLTSITPNRTNNKLATKKNHKNSANKGTGSDYLTDLNITSAWELSEGMGYIGAIDNGVQVDHPAIVPFDGSNNYIGGNLLEGFYAIDLEGGDFNIDENQPFDTQGISAFEPCDLADGVDDDMATTKFVGHGTHISGLLAAKSSTVNGVCRNCGLSMMKNADNNRCLDFLTPPQMFPFSSNSASVDAMETLASLGVGVVNWSGGSILVSFDGTQILNDEFYCPDNLGYCDALEYMREQNVLMSSSAGNHRVGIQFPASETETVAVGGLQKVPVNNGEQLIFWNESPNDSDPNNIDYFDFSDSSSCPRFGVFSECGSHISYSPIDQKLDAMTQAKSVFSTFYEGGMWADDIGCVDDLDPNNADGFGFCTGTSMSAPQVTGILQLFRSTNPLLPNGTYDPSLNVGIINVLNATSNRSTSGQGVSDFLGYGLPNARLGLEKILGRSDGDQLTTRLSPMFGLISTGENNNVYTPFPQVAAAFLLNNGAGYIPDTNIGLVNEFTEFWYDTENLTFPAPRAEFYVFTTNNNPFTGVKDMVPLRRMEKNIGTNRNDTYAVLTAEIESFHNDDYNYAGIEGYILPTCSPVPSCIPTGAIALYRDEIDILNHKLVPTNTAPSTSTLLGYVYLNQDTDNDGLIDGQEIILGTNINNDDTDGDDVLDGVEYPPAGVPVSDPLIDNDIIFISGFEPPMSR